MENKKFNFNSFLVLVLMAGGALISSLGFTQLSDIKESIRTVHAEVSNVRAEAMPRHEVELQISAIKESQSHCETQILEVKARQAAVEARQAAIELDMARRGIK